MSADDRNNVFASILRGEAPCRKVYEDAFALAFHDIYPQAAVHVLVIPKGEYVSFVDFTASASAELQTGFWRAVAEVARQLGVDGRLSHRLATIGPGGGQVVFHFHVHIVSGRTPRDPAAGAAGRRGAARRRPRRAAAAGQWYASGPKRRELRFAGAAGATLAGTLLLPLGSEIQRVPGVVLIAGSGPTDRDGNNPLIPVQVDVLNLIAERLAAAGIATLRYDKRGIGQSTARPPDARRAEERSSCGITSWPTPSPRTPSW